MGRKTKFLFGVILTLLAIIACHSCDKQKYSGFIKPDSVYVTSCIESVVNPQFNSVQEVKLFQNKLTEEYSIDEMFRSMPKEMLDNVAAVCFKKSTVVTKQDIVKEYVSNRAVYDNLPNQSTPQNHEQAAPTQTTMEEQQLPAGKTSYRYEIDTVDGKPQRVLVKEERTYEQ